MKCKSGRHEWMNPVSAERCCDPKWKRVWLPGRVICIADSEGATFSRDPIGWHYWAKANESEVECPGQKNENE